MNAWRLTLTIGAAVALLVALWSMASNAGREGQINALGEKADSLGTRLQDEREPMLAPRAERPTSASPSEPVAPSEEKGAAAAAGQVAASSDASNLGDREEETEREARARSPSSAPSSQQVVAHFEEAFFTSPDRDPAWAEEAQSQAVSKLRGILPQSSQMRGAECHSTICRIETVHDDLESYQQFARRVVLDPASRPWNGAVFTAVLENGRSSDGRLATVMYIAREGQDLPMPPRANHQRDAMRGR